MSEDTRAILSVVMIIVCVLIGWVVFWPWITWTVGRYQDSIEQYHFPYGKCSTSLSNTEWPRRADGGCYYEDR